MSAAPRRAVVVGAGLAGLAAAHALARERIDVTVLESRSADDWTPCDVAPAHFCAVPRAAPALFGLAMELGLQRRVQLVPLRIAPASRASEGLAPGGAVRAPRRGWAASRRAAELLRAAARGLRAPAELLRARRLRRLLQWYGPWLDAREPERGARLDDRSAADFCRLYLGSGPRSRRLLGSLELAWGADPAELSRLALLLMLDPWGEFCAAAPLGLAELREALARRQKDLRFAATVRSVAAGARSVVLDSGERIEADAVVLATDPPTARELALDLSPAESALLSRGRALDALALRVCVGRVSAAAPGPSQAGLCGLASAGEGALAGLVEVTALDPQSALEADRPAGRRVWLLRARAPFAARAAGRSDAELSARLLAEAQQLCPGLLERAEGHQLERVRGAFPQLRVGCFRDAERLRAEVARRRDRPLFFAHAAFAGGHPEAGLAAGLRAADDCALLMRERRS